MVIDREGKMTDLLCLVCSEPIKLPQYIPQDYKGELVCQKCKSLLHIKLENSQVVEYRILKDKSGDTAALKVLQEIKNAALKKNDEE